MDNKFFNVNGVTKASLKKAVDLLLFNEYGDYQKVRGYYYHKDKGLVLTWHVSGLAMPFTNRMGKKQEIKSDELTELLWEWLGSDEAKDVNFGDFEDNMAHDGTNKLGWRLYTEDWGHISINTVMDSYSIGAFKPMYLWYGK